MRSISILSLAVLALLPAHAFACASCGCTLSTDAAAGYSSQSGWRINLDYSYIDQDQLRRGSGSASPEQVVDHPVHPTADGGEIEKDTINRYLNLGLTYRPNPDWGFTAVLPWVSRNSQTTAVFLAMFGGFFALQYFYLGDRRRGFKYLAFCWTAIPWFIGFYDTVKFARLDAQEFDARYGERSEPAAGART